jgi:hypothetical protein
MLKQTKHCFVVGFSTNGTKTNGARSFHPGEDDHCATYFTIVSRTYEKTSCMGTIWAQSGLKVGPTWFNMVRNKGPTRGSGPTEGSIMGSNMLRSQAYV